MIYSKKSFIFFLQYTFIFGSLFVLMLSNTFAQEDTTATEPESFMLDYRQPKEYEIASIKLEGAESSRDDIVISLTGLKVGEEIAVPGPQISEAINKLWELELYSDIQILADKVVDGKIHLLIKVQEKPRLSKFRFLGIRKGEVNDLKESIGLTRGKPVTQNLRVRTKNIVKNYFAKKGFQKTTVEIEERADTGEKNTVVLDIKVDKGNKVKIKAIEITGNENVKEGKIRRLMKETKQKNFLRFYKASRYIEEEFETDLQSVIDYYNSIGYRDAKIEKDSVYFVEDDLLKVEIKIHEGPKYYFRDIEWEGNVKYGDSTLSNILGIKKGDVYNPERIQTQLYGNPNGQDVSALYMNQGHLFFNVTPYETVEGDSADITFRVYEGPQATVNKVVIKGNTKTKEHVIRREIRTLPGATFSRADVIRSQRELANLGYFDQEKLAVNPIPHPEDGTVDIEYVVEEKPSDQVELSAGWGANRLVGTIGLVFNNFSAKDIFNLKKWNPLPSGGGQRLSLRGQSTGRFYQSLNFSFTEPWLGGKRPNSLSVSSYITAQNFSSQSLRTIGGSVILGTRLRKPDDFFLFQSGIEYQNFKLNNFYTGTDFTNGIANNLNLTTTISRNSIDAPLYPRRGSEISLTMKLTPPYSLFSDKDYSQLSIQEKYKWVEYHKWKFDANWYAPVIGDLVFKLRASIGYLGHYNDEIGPSPFERFQVGGDGLTNFQLFGREIVSLRGYDTFTGANDQPINFTIFDKFTMELRYPLSLNPQSTIYGRAFLEGGNGWMSFKEFDPFDLRRTAGVGVRVFLPFFGLLGVDYGIGFDKVSTGNIFDKGRINILLGFEPY